MDGSTQSGSPFLDMPQSWAPGPLIIDPIDPGHQYDP